MSLVKQRMITFDSTRNYLLVILTKCNRFFFQISYYNQASPEVIPYISTDIAGLSSSFYNSFCSCSQYLTKNRLQSSSEDSNKDSPACDSGADSLSETLHSTQL